MEQRLVSHGDECLVVLVGFRQSLGSNATGLLERCELRALELPCPDDACRVLETIAPDAVVLDSHHASLKTVSGPAGRILRVIAEHGTQDRQIPLIVLAAAGTSAELHRAFLGCNAVLVPSRLQTYRHIAALVRRLCGLPDGCCAVGESTQSRFNELAIVASHRRYRR
jgi:hypothetical protein